MRVRERESESESERERERETETETETETDRQTGRIKYPNGRTKTSDSNRGTNKSRYIIEL